MIGEVLQSHSGCWSWILTPLCVRRRQIQPPPSRQPKCGGHQLHIRAWIVLETLGRHQARDTCPAKPPSLLCHRNQLRLQLRLSLMPAPAANGDGHGRAAARDSGCHAGIVQGVGSHGARALGKGTAARQRPARVTGHCHLTERRGHHHPWQQRAAHPPCPHSSG